MHETVAAAQLLEAALSRIEGRPGRIVRLAVRLGTLEGLSPAALRDAFVVAAEGTAAEGAELAVRRGPSHILCERCGQVPMATMTGTLRHPPSCPECGSPNVAIVDRGWSLESVRIVT